MATSRLLIFGLVVLFAVIVGLIAGGLAAYDKASLPRAVMTGAAAFAAVVALGIAAMQALG
jgi:hypothetical protein